ncbi:MAG TPA: hypothetical protein VJS45_13425 [Acidimicrobiia bacterium]|nr:hypothetical protein [Acidimicrobiia bacterium]
MPLTIGLGSGGAVLVAALLLAGGSEPSSGSGRKAEQEASLAGSEIVCPPEQGLAGTDLGRFGPHRESPEAAVAAVTEAFGGYPARGYRYQPQGQEGGDWVYFLGTAGTVPKARISVRHLADGWAAVAISACAGDYPAGLVDYPADRPVPPLPSSAGLLLAVNDPLQRTGPTATLALHDAAGRTVWELPRVGAWYPTPLSWSPDGRRFLFQVSAGAQTETRVVSLSDGRDVAVPGALTWIADDALLVVQDGRLGRLELPSGTVVAGPPLTESVSSHAGTRGRAALLISAAPHAVRIVDSELNTQDTTAPPGTVDCFSPAWTEGGLHLDVVCRRANPQTGAPDTDVFEIDIGTLRWTRLPTGTVGSFEQRLRSPASG